jgi:membrane protease YdiL (CAAX protease family)
MATVAHLNISPVYLPTGILLLNELGYLFIKEKRNEITACAASQGFVNSVKRRNLCKYVV